jgi:hypothetical protein
VRKAWANLGCVGAAGMSKEENLEKLRRKNMKIYFNSF